MALTKVNCFGLSQAYGGAAFNTSLNGVASYKPGSSIGASQYYKASISHVPITYTKLGQFYTEVSAGNTYIDQVIGKFGLVNGIPFFSHYGKVTHTLADTTQTIVPMTTTQGRKPRYKLCIGAGAMKENLYGIMWNDLALEYKPASPVICTQIGVGCKYELSTATPTAAIYPSSVGTNFDTFVSCTWNSVAIGALSEGWSFRSRYDTTPRTERGQTWYEDHNEGNEMKGTFMFPFTGEETNFFTDYLAMTPRTFTLKMQKGSDATRYFEFTCTNALANINLYDEEDQYGGGVATVTVGATSIVCSDAVDDDFYTIVA